MGLFRRKEKQYTLGEAMKIIAKPGNESLTPVAIHPGNPNTNYWIREEEQVLRQMHIKNPTLRTKTISEKKNEFLSEINGNGQFRGISANSENIVNYNNYQSARNYQKKYGQSR